MPVSKLPPGGQPVLPQGPPGNVPPLGHNLQSKTNPKFKADGQLSADGKTANAGQQAFGNAATASSRASDRKGLKEKLVPEESQRRPEARIAKKVKRVTTPADVLEYQKKLKALRKLDESEPNIEVKALHEGLKEQLYQQIQSSSLDKELQEVLQQHLEYGGSSVFEKAGDPFQNLFISCIQADNTVELGPELEDEREELIKDMDRVNKKLIANHPAVVEARQLMESGIRRLEATENKLKKARGAESVETDDDMLQRLRQSIDDMELYKPALIKGLIGENEQAIENLDAAFGQMAEIPREVQNLKQQLNERIALLGKKMEIIDRETRQKAFSKLCDKISQNNIEKAKLSKEISGIAKQGKALMLPAKNPIPQGSATTVGYQTLSLKHNTGQILKLTQEIKDKTSKIGDLDGNSIELVTSHLSEHYPLTGNFNFKQLMSMLDRINKQLEEVNTDYQEVRQKGEVEEDKAELNRTKRVIESLKLFKKQYIMAVVEEYNAAIKDIKRLGKLAKDIPEIKELKAKLEDDRDQLLGRLEKPPLRIRIAQKFTSLFGKRKHQ